jgi:hypothetical protein
VLHRPNRRHGGYLPSPRRRREHRMSVAREDVRLS